MTLISNKSLPDMTDKNKVIDYATRHANEPKEALIRILDNLRSHGMGEQGICHQLSRIIDELESWQNR